MIEIVLSLFFIYKSSPFFPALTAFSFLPPVALVPSVALVPPVSPVSPVPPVSPVAPVPLVPPVAPVSLVPLVPFLPAFSPLPYTNLERTLSEPSANDERTITNFCLFFLFVKILRFLQQKASKTDNLSTKDLLVASLLRFLQNNEYHKTMLNC